jgi:hypothetical protein
MISLTFVIYHLRGLDFHPNKVEPVGMIRVAFFTGRVHMNCPCLVQFTTFGYIWHLNWVHVQARKLKSEVSIHVF